MTAPVSRTGATGREVEAHDFCCGPGEQFMQQAEEVLSGFLLPDDDTVLPDILLKLLPVVLAYGDARAPAALGREVLVRRIEASLSGYMEDWQVTAAAESVADDLDDVLPTRIPLLAEQPGGGR